MEPTHISTNPFTHIANGLKKVRASSLQQLVILIVLQAIFSTVITFLLMGLPRGPLQQLVLHSDYLSRDEIVRAGAILFGLVASLAVIGSLLSLTTDRLVLVGVRKQKITISDALSFAMERLLLSITIGVGIMGSILVGGLVLGTIAPPLFVIFALVVLVLLIIYLPTLVMTAFVVIDDKKPAGPLAALKQAKQSAGKVTGKIWVFIAVSTLTVMGLSMVLDVFMPSMNTFAPPTSPSITQATGTTSLLSNATESTVTSAVGILFTIGLAELYNQTARQTATTKKSKAPRTKKS